MPALRSTLTVFVPPWNVGVAPTTGPLVPCWIVMLCINGDMFVKMIVTFPAFAVSELFVNFNAPLGSAASDSDPLAAGTDPVVADDEALDAGDDEAEAELAVLLLLLLLLELPHAATPSASATALSAATGYLDKEDLLSLG